MADSPRTPTQFALPLAGPPGADARKLFLRRMTQLAGLILALLVLGTIGFVVTEDTSAWFGFAWALDTIATVGSIPSPDSTGGEVLKVVLVVLGVGTLFYALVTVTEFFVAGHLAGLIGERRTLRMIDSLSDHHVICGFGRVGRQVAQHLREAGDDLVVIDLDPDKRALAEGLGAPFIEGSVSDDDVLRRAGLERARSVIACVDSDAENIFVTLTARELHPDVTIVARASVEDSEKKLRRAGADRVISPYKTSGIEMARLALHPQVPASIEVTPEHRLEEIEVTPDCDGAGRTVEEVRGSSLIVAVRTPDGEIELEPGPERLVKPGEILLAVGNDDAMDHLEGVFAPRGRRPRAGGSRPLRRMGVD